MILFPMLLRCNHSLHLLILQKGDDRSKEACNREGPTSLNAKYQYLMARLLNIKINEIPQFRIFISIRANPSALAVAVVPPPHPQNRHPCFRVLVRG